MTQDRATSPSEADVARSAASARLSLGRPLLFLIGYRGTGKTTTARLLADRLSWHWLDSDAVIEQRAGRSIREIFADEGEAGFRCRESLVMQELCLGRKLVVATGGGIVLADANRRLIRQSGSVVWLTANAETIWRRIQCDPATAERRPNLRSGGLSEIVDLQAQRAPLYHECADLTVDTAALSPEDVVGIILAQVIRD